MDNGEKDPRLGKTSASNAAADELCPGRHKAQQAAYALQPEKQSKEAAFGDAVHAALAAQDPSKLTHDQVMTYDLCQQVEETLLKRFFGPDVDEARKRCWRHKRLWGVFGGHEHSGELDVMFRHANRALVIEYKSLFGDTESSPRNKQLRDQAVLAWKHFLTVDTLGVAVDQPHITLKPDICLYTKADLEQSEKDMAARIAASNNGNPRRVAGSFQCEWCAAKAFCREYAEWVTSKAPMPVPLTQVPLAEWTPAQISLFLENKNAIESWLELAYNEAKERLKKNPEAIPGFYLSEGNNMRVVTKVNELYARFEQLGGKLGDFHDCIDVALGKLKGELRKITGAKGKQLELAFDALLSGLIEEYQIEKSIRKKKER